MARTTSKTPEMEVRAMMIFFRACSDSDRLAGLLLLLLVLLLPAPVLSLLLAAGEPEGLVLPSKGEDSWEPSIECLGLAPSARPSSAADRLCAMRKEVGGSGGR